MRICDKLYVDYSGGRYEAWCYSDGQRVDKGHGFGIGQFANYAKSRGFELVLTESAERRLAGDQRSK